MNLLTGVRQAPHMAISLPVGENKRCAYHQVW